MMKGIMDTQISYITLIGVHDMQLHVSVCARVCECASMCILCVHNYVCECIYDITIMKDYRNTWVF
jgi:hypothetical protein